MFAFFTPPSANRLNDQSDRSDRSDHDDHTDHNDWNGHGHSPAPALDLPALVGAAAWSRLPAAVQRRFGAAHADVTYQGHLDMRCSAIGHVYAALARLWGGPLTHLNRRAVPTTVRVSHNGCGGVVWERRFHTPSTGAAAAEVAGVNGAGAVGDADGNSNSNSNSNSNGRTVRSTKELGADGGLLERTDGGLSMSLDVFEENGALVFRSRSFWWVLGRMRLAMPALLTPGTCTVAHTDLGCGQFRFTLSMQHPWWGETFHQSGVFTDPCSGEDDSTDTHTSVTTNVTAST